MISVENLVFDYPGLRALHGLTFRIDEGSITALVGPNGAGKTTLLRCIASLETPVAGRISVDGVDVHEAPRQCHRSMGYLSDFFGLYNELTVEQCLRHRAAAQDVPPGEHAERVSRAAQRTGLGDRLGQKAGELSRGLRQRLAIAQSILHEPRVVLLDEPASGLDPEARSELSRLFLGLRAGGMTLVVSSHILAELEDYSTHMMILREGRLVEHRRIDGAEGVTQRVTVVVRLAEPSEHLPALVRALPDCEVISADRSGAKFVLPAPALERHRALKRLMDEGLAVAAFEELRPDLQEAYLARLRKGPRS